MTEDLSKVNWEWESTLIMYELKDKFGDFDLDDFYRFARQVEMPPALIRKYSDKLLREWELAGYIEATSEFRPSERDSLRKLQVYRRKTWKTA